ncbi:MAG TPA: hypothetical protein VGO91_19085 [Pyrinomonadaceae bacterium]|jgi:hypothetical protein|nr:hypothetical protein [Pyrinomonadaceae bacterium]
MTRRETIWLLVRSAGVLFLALACWYILNLFGDIVGAALTPGLFARSTGVFLDLIIRIIFLLWIAVYLLSNGDILFRMLGSMPDADG